MTEDGMILKIAVRQALATLPEEDRTMVGLYYQIDEPKDYTGAWPPTFASVAEYIGNRFSDGSLAESTIRYRMRVVLDSWRASGILNR